MAVDCRLHTCFFIFPQNCLYQIVGFSMPTWHIRVLHVCVDVMRLLLPLFLPAITDAYCLTFQDNLCQDFLTGGRRIMCRCIKCCLKSLWHQCRSVILQYWYPDTCTILFVMPSFCRMFFNFSTSHYREVFFKLCMIRTQLELLCNNILTTVCVNYTYVNQTNLFSNLKKWDEFN